ncbi:MAG: 1,4-dihydroxy-2-naphthoate octaprenyltransferase [Proteobacteria bacterium]|nr:1,4-dihydroxy-2-naphthoate octaprenyltransferase [Pseudomonadota bacterium]
MSSQSVRPLNPAPEEFAGDSFGRSLKRAFHATRPKFYPASVLPVVTGTAWGAFVSESFDPYVCVLALLATVCVHAAANALNDVGDETIGTDGRNENRIYPYTGGSRFIQMGILSQSRMLRLGVVLLLVAAVAGMLLYLARGPIVLAFGLIGIALAVLYSLGPFRLASLGLGETAVAVAFGVLPVSGAAWLQGAAIDTSLIVFSLPVSAWVAAILLINEVPDIEADGASGKNTLPVRLGNAATAALYLGIQIAAAFFVTILAIGGDLPPLAPLVPFALLVLAWKAAAGIRGGTADRETMTKSIEGTLGIHTIGCIWLTACALFALWF